MKHPYWSEIYYYFKEVEEQKEKLKNKKLSNDLLTTARTSVTTSMNHLKNNLKQILDEASVTQITFCLVALLDEEMQRFVSASAQNVDWKPLQKEFFNITNAGEVFFERLDDALENPNFPPIVFEIFYFTLNKGFRGKYQHSPLRIAKYNEFLFEKIPQPTVTKKDKAKSTILPLPTIKFKVWQYYAAACALLAAVYIAVTVNTNLS